MRKLALATVALFLVGSASAMGAAQNWSVTEERASGIKDSQGTWTLMIDGDKLTGSATLSSDSGNTLTYNLEGAIKDGVYTVKMVNRSDNKKDCVWTGHARTATAAGKSTGFVGDVTCTGAKLIIHATGM
jgi:hypothetical protein